MKRSVQVNRESFFRALILLGFCSFLLWLVLSNNIIFYIHPRFEKLTVAAAALLFVMFLAQAGSSFQRPSGHRHNGGGIFKLVYLPFVATLLIAFLLPSSSLDAGIASKKGMDLGALQAAAQTGSPNAVAANDPAQVAGNGYDQIPASPASNPEQVKIDEIRNSGLINVTEDNFKIVNNETYMFPEKYAGKEITMLGFVYKEADMLPGQFALGRYVITCCSADAFFTGFLCEYKNAADFEEGSWLNIRGTIKIGQYKGSRIPVVAVTTVNKAAGEPENPYVY